MHWLAVEWVKHVSALKKGHQRNSFLVAYDVSYYQAQWRLMMIGFPPFIIISIWESKAEPWLQTVAALKMPQKFRGFMRFPKPGVRGTKLETALFATACTKKPGSA
jgi:hypothetical protein